jgi:hypothetical protein
VKNFLVACLVATILAIGIGGWALRRHRGASGVSLSTPAPVRAIGNSKWIASKLGQLPLSFEENRGQFDSRVKFLTRGAEYGLFLSGGQATIVHKGRAHITDGGDASSPIAALGSSDVITKSVTQLTWVGANPNAQPHGDGHQAGESNYLIGKDPSKWRRHVQHYDRVRLTDLYRGIDLVYHSDQQQVEMDYIVAPHVDSKAIQIAISGPSIVTVDASGQLSISSAGDELKLLAPVAYQEKNGRREIVQARYILAASHQVGFELGAYDQSRPLVIDPVLTFAATFGTGSNQTIISDVQVDSNGNIYLSGTTCDTNYPTTSGAFQTSGGSNLSAACYDAVVTKLNPTASQLLYSTYIGGQTNVDFAVHLLVNTAGEATVAGTTGSIDFPTTSGAYQRSLKSGTCNYSPFFVNQPCADAFLLKLSADGSSLVYSTLFGGERGDMVMGLAQDTSGDSYISGLTDSTQLPVNSSSYSSTYNGAATCQGGTLPCFNGFIAKLNPNGTQLLASTYLGGTDDDNAAQVAVDTSGNVYVTGTADSVNFPTTAGAYRTTHAGPVHSGDAYLAKLDSTLHTLQYSTFFGGSAEDISINLRVDATGAAYITGSTLSSDLPTTLGAFQTTYKGAPLGTTQCISALDTSILNQPTCGDVFLAKIDPSKSGAAQLDFATYIGGSANDFAYTLSLDSQQNVWILGDTNSPDFPLTSDAYFSNGSTANLFLSEIKNDGTQLLFSTFLSQLSSNGALGLGLTIDPSNDVYVAGQGTVSPTPGAYSASAGVFVMEFSSGTARPGVLLSATSIAFPTATTPVGATSAPQSVTLTNNGTATLHLTVAMVPAGASIAAPFSEYDNCGNTLAPAAMCTINAVYQPVTASGNFDSGVVRILSDAPGAPHTITLSGLSGTLDSASLIPPALTFNGQAPGTVSPPQTSGINNPATALSLLPVTTGLPVVSGPNASEFVVNAGSPGNCPVATHQCFVSVTFNPAVGDVTGTRTATVSIPTNAANSPQTLSLTGNVSTGSFALFTPPAITPITVGLTLNTSVVLKNTGGSALIVTGVTAGGSNSGEYVLSNTSGCTGYPAFTVASQGLCLLNLAFTPSATGTRSATFTLVDNEVNPAVLTLSGYAQATTGPALALLLSPTPINGQVRFPDTVVGKNAGLVTANGTILNEGNASGQITSFSLPGTDFAQTNTCQAAIPASASCTFTVTFSPTTTGLRTGTLTLSTNSPGGQTFTVNFAGTGVQAPAVTVTPPNINFGAQAVGTTTTTAQVATVTNSGNGTLSLSNVTLTGPFTDTTTCGTTLVANTSCTYSFKFVPAAAGNAGGILSATTNAAGGVLAIGLNGSGVTGGVPRAQPASLSFGPQPVGTRSSIQTVSLSNVGATAFTIAGVRATENFSATSNCPSSLGAGASCTISTTFAPTTDTNTSSSAPFFTTGGNVFVTIGAPGSPFSIPVSGDATPSTGAATNLVITSSPNPSTVGQSVTLTANVTATSGTGTPTGTVTFFGGGGAIQLDTPITLSGGKATFTTSALPAGFNSITINYSGDGAFAPENSSGFVQNVTGGTTAATTTTVQSSVNPSTAGQNVTFTATVASTTLGTIAGTITFFDGATQIGSPVTVSGGSASISTTTLAQGSQSITARYSGNSAFSASTSSALSQTVNAVSGPSIVVNTTAPTVVAGQSVPINLTAFAPAGSTLVYNLSCVGAPAKATCSFSPNPVTPVVAGTPVVLTFGTSSSGLPPAPSNRSPWPWGMIGFFTALAALLATGMFQSRQIPRRRLAFGMCLAVVVLAAVVAGCGSYNGGGGSGYTGTPKGTSTFTVTGTSTTGTPATTVSTQVSVTVQ